MNTELQQRIEHIHSICGAWGLYEPGNSSVEHQQVKAVEEIGEIAKWHLKRNKEEVMDGIGDVTVCWVNADRLGGPGLMHIPLSYSPGAHKAIIMLDAGIPNLGLLEYVAANYSLTLLECIDSAIEVISKRTGKIISGTFIKD